MPPNNGKKPPPKVGDTDPGAPLDMLKTGQMRAIRPRPAPKIADDEERTDVDPQPKPGAFGDRTLVYDQNKSRPAGGGARLVISAGPKAGQAIDLAQAEITIGRGSDNALVIPDISVSRHHAVIKKEARGYVLLDKGSGNGTRVNGNPIKRHELSSGDEIDLGDTSMQFVEEGGVLVRGGKRAEPQAPRPLVRKGAWEKPAEDPAEVTNPRATGLQRRTPLYLVVLIAVALALGAGLYRKKVRERAEREAAEQSHGGRAVARQRFNEAVDLVKSGRWIEARDKLVVAASLDDQDEEIRRYLERAQAEAPRAQAVAKAEQAVSRRNYLEARTALGAVPEDSALADRSAELLDKVRLALDLAVRDARAKAETGDAATAEALLAPVLEAEPNRRDALAVKDLLRENRRAPPRRERPEEPAAEPKPRPREEPADEPAPSADLKSIVESYLSGDVRSAITRAESAGVTDGRAARMARELRELDAAWREGLQKSDAKKPGEALRALETADQLDRSVARGRGSKIGREVRALLARIHYQVGVGSLQTDDGLPAAARHLRAAVQADPENDLAQQQLSQVGSRAKEIYLRAYVAKDSDGEAAKKAFRLVAEILPASDETGQKARRWLAKLEGKRPKDE